MSVAGELKYTVEWTRETEPEEMLRCTKLTPRLALRRLQGAIKESGPITVHSLTREED